MEYAVKLRIELSFFKKRETGQFEFKKCISDIKT